MKAILAILVASLALEAAGWADEPATLDVLAYDSLVGRGGWLKEVVPAGKA